MKILDLVLKKEWYDLIKNGDKREEYREIKPYWLTRLFGTISKKDAKMYCDDIEKLIEDINDDIILYKGFTHIKFRRGYTNEYVIFRLDDITIGKGKKELGAPDEDVFILKIAKNDIKAEFNLILNNILLNRVKEYFIDDKVNIDKILEMLTNDLIGIFHDTELKFTSNNDLNNFILYGSDEHTKEIIDTLLK